MATTAAEADNTSNKPATEGRRRTRGGDRAETRLDSHIDKPSTVAPGDAPFDTTDPAERAISVSPDKAAAARAGYGTVNAVVPAPVPERDPEPEVDERVEEYRQLGPDGKLVTVRHNLDTGVTTTS